MELKVWLIPASEFERVRASSLPADDRLRLLADMSRVNTLSAVKRAGSGHLGSSFSAMDIVVFLYEEEMNLKRLGLSGQERDVYFSSKGHDVPGQYSVLYSLGFLEEERLLKLRRLNGLEGHPNVGVPGIEANSGSLGMGISKGRGMAWAKTAQGLGGRVFVLTGDGELQEGQIYEALQTTRQQRVENLLVIVDHNKLQTDKYVAEITDLGDLERKFEAFGWNVGRCDGHDYAALRSEIKRLLSLTGPKILIADTVKGKGVSFMEHPQALQDGGGLYKWHSGAPDDASFLSAQEELLNSVRERFQAAGLGEVATRDVTPETKAGAMKAQAEFVAEGYGDELLDLGKTRNDIVVLDGDLSADCRVRKFENGYPGRFIENGIAEQDMVSMAGGLALHGMLPVVNSFVSFLGSRANEQIYTNAGEGTKIIYACHFGGLIPAGPGKSHQSIRDISLFAALPNATIVQPGTYAEARAATRWMVDEADGPCFLRLAIGPSPRNIELPENYLFEPGVGSILREGRDAVLFAYGPVMLNEALLASEHLGAQGFGLRVVNMPWLNRFDAQWLNTTLEDVRDVYVLDDHSPVGGLGDQLLSYLATHHMMQGLIYHKLGVEGYPACGTPPEVLAYHGLDGASLAAKIGGSQSRQFEYAGVYTDEAPQ